MRTWRSATNHLPATLGVAFVLAILVPAAAQQLPPPTLVEILQATQRNLNRYDATIPSFFCDEHVVSQVAVGGTAGEYTTTDSIFRLKRAPRPDGTISLEESRQVKTVDSKPATGDEITGPATLRGAFEGGLAVVSLNPQACMRYSLDRIKPSRAPASYVVRFASDPDPPPQPSGCLIQESARGRVIINPATMQIKRMELTVPQHTIFPAGESNGVRTPPIVGEMIVSVDYQPTLLDGQIFWLPATITSSTTNQANTLQPTTWSFKATYRNYHKLEVTSRILPATDAPAP
jgi:hypothetical protein